MLSLKHYSLTTNEYHYSLKGVTIRKSSLCCLFASFIIFGILFIYTTTDSLTNPVGTHANPLGVLILFFFSVLFFGLGIMINRASSWWEATASIIASVIYLTIMRFVPGELEVIYFTFPAAILVLLGGIFGFLEKN